MPCSKQYKYSKECEKYQFFTQYAEATTLSQMRNIEQLRALVVDMLENPIKPPENIGHWPIASFISKTLEQNIPLNWLTNPPFKIDKDI